MRRRDTWSWTGSVSVDFPGLGPELRAGRMCPSLGSVLKCPHMETSWTELEWAFPNVTWASGLLQALCSSWALSHTSLLLVLGNKQERWKSDPDECSRCEHQPLLAVVSAGDSFTCCYSWVWTGTLPPSTLLPLSWWHSQRVSGKAVDLQQPALRGNACTDQGLFLCVQNWAQGSLQEESRLAQWLSVGLAIWLGREKKVRAHLASIYPRLDSVRIQ